MEGNFKMFTTPTGSIVFVGRNAKENEKLTLDIGKVGDLWFHVASFPGAHVIMKHPQINAQYKEFSIQDIHYAARLAKSYSKNTAKKTKVSWCDVSNVYKSKYDPIGMVTIKGLPNVLLV